MTFEEIGKPDRIAPDGEREQQSRDQDGEGDQQSRSSGASHQIAPHLDIMLGVITRESG